MHDVNHAVANLRDLSGIEALEFDANGNLTLIFDERTEINFSRIDEQTIELWTEFQSFNGMYDSATLRWVLEANYLGAGTGSARIALAPEKHTPILCERVLVGPLTGDQFSHRILEFLKHAAFWNSAEGARAALAGVSEPASFPANDFSVRA